MFKNVPLWSSLGSGRGSPDLWPNRQARPPCTFVCSCFSFFGGGLCWTTSSASSCTCALRRHFFCFFLSALPVTSLSAAGEATGSTVVTVAVGARLCVFLAGLGRSSTSSSDCWCSSTSIAESRLMADRRLCDPLLLKEDVGVDVLWRNKAASSSSSSSSTSSFWTARFHHWQVCRQDCEKERKV